MPCAAKPSDAFAWRRASQASNWPMSSKPSGAPLKARPRNSKPRRNRVGSTAWRWGISSPQSRAVRDLRGPAGPYAPNSRRDRQADVDRQALRGMVLGLDRALHRLDIAPRDRQPDPEGCRTGFLAAPAGREIAVEDLIELRRRD